MAGRAPGVVELRTRHPIRIVRQCHAADAGQIVGSAAPGVRRSAVGRIADRRHALEIDGDRARVGFGQMAQAVVDGFGHRAGGLPLVRGTSVAHVGDRIVVAPSADAAGSVGRDVGSMPRADLAAAKFVRRLFGHQQIARPVRQGCAVPFAAPARVRSRWN